MSDAESVWVVDTNWRIESASSSEHSNQCVLLGIYIYLEADGISIVTAKDVLIHTYMHTRTWYLVDPALET